MTLSRPNGTVLPAKGSIGTRLAVLKTSTTVLIMRTIADSLGDLLFGQTSNQRKHCMEAATLALAPNKARDLLCALTSNKGPTREPASLNRSGEAKMALVARQGAQQVPRLH